MGCCRTLLVIVVLFSTLLVALTACSPEEGASPTTVDSSTPDISAPMDTELETPERVADRVRVTPDAHTPPTPHPTYTPHPLPPPLPSQTPYPTPTPISDARLSVVLDTASEPAVDGLESRIEFTVTNEAPATASSVTLTFEVYNPSRLLSARSTRGTCEESVCDLGSIDGYKSVTGHVVVLAKRGLDADVRVDAEISWLLRDSNRTYSRTEADVPLAENNNEPGGVVWATPTQATGMSCDDALEVGPEAVYAAFGEKLYAVSKLGGDMLWLNDRAGWVFQPTLSDGNIYFDTREREPTRYYLRSLNSSNGALNWEHLVDGQVRGPAAVYGSSVYYTVNYWVIEGRSAYSYLLSVDAATGGLNWEYRVEEWVNTSAVEFGGGIYFGTHGHLYSVDPRSGELNRRYPTGGRLSQTPLIADGNAYFVVGRGSKLSSLDLSTGGKNWEYLPEGRAETPVLYDGSLHFRVYDEDADDYRSVHALDATTGSLKWKYESDRGLEQLTVSDGSVYVTTFQSLISMGASTGSLNWEAAHDICGPLVAADGVLYGRAWANNRPIIFAIGAD